MSERDADVLDLLVVGGGPGGTAAAFRAHELGHRVLVVDFDDLMKRIRDYSKDKLILPTFGGGDRMAFPKGGDCISRLPFEPIDKDELCERWKGLYESLGVPYRLGLELTGLRRLDSGAWEAALWDHGSQEEALMPCRHVVLALGRGVPRRLDVPGQTQDVALRMTDPMDYVGAPACVIGGGTSAAEAVIAISQAKVRAGDRTDVYWSYRGDKLPRVSKALAEVFFEAYVGNGNIRYFRRSEPAAVVIGDDHEEYLAVRVDRRRSTGRPIETTHLEFPKRCCVACIGDDLPEALLADLGIRLRVGGKRKRKRMTVNRYLETELDNVYLVGDILSQAYLVAEDFDGDPSSFAEVTHRGNIKTALRDGVYVAGVVSQRLAGRTEIEVEVEDAEDPSMVRSAVIATLSGEIPLDRSGEAGGPAEGPLLVRMLPTGVQAEEYALPEEGRLTIGRRGCDVDLADDARVSDEHASLVASADGFVLRDEASETGVFLRVPSTRMIRLGPGDLLCAGRQFLVFRGGGEPCFEHYDARGREIGRVPIPERTEVLGRDAPDVVLDAADRSLSRRHLSVRRNGETVEVKDLRSVNGTYLRVRGERRLEPGDVFRIGQELFAFGLEREDVLDVELGPPPARAALGSAEIPRGAGAAEDRAPVTGPRVSFRGTGRTVAVAPGQTVCDAAESAGVSIQAECHSGICGSDPVRIVGGAEHVVDAASPQESETLEDICGLEPGPCRLACMLRVRGPVEVEIVE